MICQCLRMPFFRFAERAEFKLIRIPKYAKETIVAYVA